MKEKINKRILLDIILLLVIGIVVFFWFGGDLIFTSGDVTFRFSPMFSLKNSFYAWSQWHLGELDIQSVAWIPYEAVLVLWDLLKLPLYIIHQLTYYFLFVVSGLGMYFLVLTIIKDKRRYLMGFLAALLYLFNCYALVMLWRMSTQAIYIYPFLPLALALFIRGTENKKLFKYVLLINGVGILAATSYSNAAFAVVFWLNFLFYLVYYFFMNQGNNRDKIFAIKLFLMSLIIWLGINSYWLVPYAKTLTSSFLPMISKSIAYETTTVETIKSLSQTAYLANAYRLYGYHPFDLNYSYGDNDPFYTFSEPYLKNYSFIILGYTIPFLVFLSLLVLSKRIHRDKFFVTYFFAFTLVILFLYKGSQPPFGGLYLWLAKSTPLTDAFRHPVAKFGSFLPLGYAVLFSYSLVEVYDFLKRRFGKLKMIATFFLLAFCLSIFVYFQYPFWTGRLFKTAGAITRGALVKIPDYYYEARDWLVMDQNEFRLAPVPMASAWSIPFNWEHGYLGLEPSYYLFHRSITTLVQPGSLSTILWQKITSGSQDDLDSVKHILPLLNVKYVFVHQDIARDYFNVDKGLFDRAVVNLEKGISGLGAKKSFGKLDFYPLDDKYFLPHVYTPSIVSLAGVNDDQISSVLVQNDVDIKNVIFFNIALKSLKEEPEDDRQRVLNQIKKSALSGQSIISYTNIDGLTKEATVDNLEMVNRPNIDYQKQNPSEYIVRVTNYQEPFLLVLSENYDPNWKAYIREKSGKVRFWETWSLQPFPEENHVTASRFEVNTWLIEGNKEQFEIILEFQPQKQIYIGIIMTLITFAILIIAIILVIIRRMSYGNKHYCQHNG